MDDDEVEYEIPCLNLVERLPGLWEPWKSCSNVLPHTGLRLSPSEAPLYHLTAVFPHLQVCKNNKHLCNFIIVITFFIMMLYRHN